MEFVTKLTATTSLAVTDVNVHLAIINSTPVVLVLVSSS